MCIVYVPVRQLVWTRVEVLVTSKQILIKLDDVPSSVHYADICYWP